MVMPGIGEGQSGRGMDSELGGAYSPPGHSHPGGPTPPILPLGSKEVRFLAQLLIYWQPMEVASSSWSFVATS